MPCGVVPKGASAEFSVFRRPPASRPVEVLAEDGGHLALGKGNTFGIGDGLLVIKAVARMPASPAERAAAGPERPKPAPPACLFIKSGAKIHRLNIRDILYMEKDGHYIVFHTAAGQWLSRMNMAELLAGLPPGEFARVHKSFVVPLAKVDTIEKHTVIIRGKEIPIGDGYRVEFLRRIKITGD